jgi:hypothetical protein
LERPDWACVLCPTPTGTRPWKQADQSYSTCEGCVKKIRKQLTDISDRYHRLDPTPGAQGDLDTRGAPGFGSKPTASVHIICMRDRRSSSNAKEWTAGDGKVHKESERPPLSVFNELDTLAWDVCEKRGFDDGPDQHDVYGLCWWLSNQLDWASRRPDVVEFARSVRSINTKLMPVTGDPRIFVAKCPTVLYEGDEVSTCDSNLYYPTSGDVIMCGNPKCGRKWESHQWDSEEPGSLKNLIKDRRKKEKEAEQVRQVDQVA